MKVSKTVFPVFAKNSTKPQDAFFIFSLLIVCNIVFICSFLTLHSVVRNLLLQVRDQFYNGEDQDLTKQACSQIRPKKMTNGLSVTAWTGLLCSLPWRQRARNIWSSLSGVPLDRVRQMCVIWLELLNRMPSNCLLSEVWHTPGCAISEGHVIRQYCAMRGVDCEECKKNALLENESLTKIGATIKWF